ncbi:MAG: peptide deformylase [Synergistales bacterium]|nr:peptide deformylase [Synergistales bacterium]
MSERTIRIYPDSVLREPNEEVTVFDKAFKEFVAEMKALMYAHDGLGLAAPQIGVSRRVAVVAHEGREYVLVNPKITASSGNQTDEEGCLSFPGLFEKVTRPDRITVEALDEEGNKQILEAAALLARAFAHEIDHLEGVLLIDRISPLRRTFAKKKFQRLREA